VGEIAAMRVPDLRLVADEPDSPTLQHLAEKWKASRVDVAAGTMQTYNVALGRVLRRYGTERVADIDASRVAELVASLHSDGLKKQTIRKTVSVLAMALDHARVQLRHRRVSLLHLGGMPWARIGELVGHDDLVTTARTYTHVVADRHFRLACLAQPCGFRMVRQRQKAHTGFEAACKRAVFRT
jgi:site-specific recombinase XerD